MITLGIDLSSMRENTSACALRWTGKRAVAQRPETQCDDACLDALIARANVVGIDAPFGWPTEFTEAVREWKFSSWGEDTRDRLRFRETDRFVQELLRLTPLSVSSDRIALPAMRAMALLKRHGVTNRSGDGKFFEVYPAGSLKAWGLESKGYKDAKDGKAARFTILRALRKHMPWLEAADFFAEDSNDLDGLIAAISAREAALGRTRKPEAGLPPMARKEGWIHVPAGWPTLKS